MELKPFLLISVCILLLLFPLFTHNSHLDDDIKFIKLKKDATFDPTRVVQISWEPRIFIYKGFLSDYECDHIIALAKHKLAKSLVADNKSGKSIKSNVRTSSGMFLQKGQDKVIADIEERISEWTFYPPGILVCNVLLEGKGWYGLSCPNINFNLLLSENGESLQVLHYEHGQKYEPHFDYFVDKVNQELGGHRVATVLMYLSNVKKGGETVFPNAEGKLSQPKDDTWSDCAKAGLAVKPSKGDAVLFFSLHPNGTTDPRSLHGSCPVIEGDKWSAPKWIHVRSFERSVGSCADGNVLCSQWAAMGECQKNPSFMVGSGGTVGNCRKSCKVCSS